MDNQVMKETQIDFSHDINAFHRMEISYLDDRTKVELQYKYPGVFRAKERKHCLLEHEFGQYYNDIWSREDFTMVVTEGVFWHYRMSRAEHDALIERIQQVFALVMSERNEFKNGGKDE